MFVRSRFIRTWALAVGAVMVLGIMPAPASAIPAMIRINEIRTDEPSIDDNEYFELYGVPGTPLDDYTYVCIGDGSTGASGIVEEAVSLVGQVIPASGYFLCAESTFTLGTPNLTRSLNFENADNITHLLVTGWSSSVNTDLDTNDDGVFDVAAWSTVADKIAIIAQENPPTGTEYHYGPPTIGPDGLASPWHVYVSAIGWSIGSMDIVGGFDTPGAANYSPPALSAVNDSYETPRNVTLSVAAPGVLANDLGSPSSAIKVSDPASGSLTLNANGSFTYAPAADYVGTVSFTYKANDGIGDSNVATVQITVTSPAVTTSPVWRFYNSRLGTHFYTADAGERARVQSTLSHVYTFEGEAYRLNAANNATPLYRFFKPTTGTHFYTASEAEKDSVRATLGHVYAFEGAAYNVSSDSGSGTKPTVHRFYNVRNGTHFYTADESERAHVQATLGATYSYDGAAFYLGQ